MANNTYLLTNTEDKQHKLVDIKNRGGLWKINGPAIQIFKIVELKFRLLFEFLAVIKDLREEFEKQL